MVKVIYDNDAAPDDIIALLFLLNNPNVDLAAITIPGTGEAHCPKGAENIANLLHHLNMPNIPIAYSEDKRCSKDGIGARFPESLRDEMDAIFNNMNIANNPNPDICDDALALMHDVISQSKKPVTILATGPLTNIANFVEAYPDLRSQIENIFVMGGAVKVGGNITVFHKQSGDPKAELNLYTDPEAVKTVFESGVKITLVPLDATNQVPLTREFVQGLAKEENPALKIMYRLLKDQVDSIGEDEFYNQFYLWDPLAAMLCARPELGLVESQFIAFDPANAVTRLVESGEESTAMINVVTGIEQPKEILNILTESVKTGRAQSLVSVASAGLFAPSSVSDVNSVEENTRSCGL